MKQERKMIEELGNKRFNMEEAIYSPRMTEKFMSRVVGYEYGLVNN